MEIRAGLINDSDLTHLQTLKIMKVYQNPFYYHKLLRSQFNFSSTFVATQNDAAILKLEGNLRYNDHVYSIPYLSDLSYMPSGKARARRSTKARPESVRSQDSTILECIHYGWGKVNNTQLSHQLKKIPLPIVDSRICYSIYERAFPFAKLIIEDQSICAGDLPNICQVKFRMFHAKHTMSYFQREILEALWSARHCCLSAAHGKIHYFHASFLH